MIDHSAWITKLAEAEDFEGKVFDIAQFVRDAGGWSSFPAIYVYPYRDDAGNVYQVVDTQAGRQSVLGTMAVLIVVQATGDDAKAFDPMDADAILLPETLDDAQVGGLGLLMIRNTASSMAYERRDGCNRFLVTVARRGADGEPL